METMELSEKMRRQNLTIREGELDQRVRACMEAVKMCIRPISSSDRTCVRKIGDWATDLCQSGSHSSDELLPRIIDHALEASKPECRNPRAVFMYLMKTQLKFAA